MEGLFRGGRRALGIASAPAAVVLLSGTIFSPQKGSHPHVRVHKRWVWVWAQSLQLPTSLLSSSTLVWPWVYVRVTWIAKYWGFQLAAVARVGEERARGQIRTGFPCRCAIWLLRSEMCFALLFRFVLSEGSEVGLAGQGIRRGWQPQLGGTGRSRAARLGYHQGWRACYTFTSWGFPPISFPSMCCDPRTALSWSHFAKLKFLVRSWDLWGFKILICKLHICKLHICKLKQLIYELSQVF